MKTKLYRINQPHQQPRGFTLVEIMIAMALGLFLVGGLIQVYASSKQSSKIQHELSGIQSNQRFVLNFLNRDIRMAGHVDSRNKYSLNRLPNKFKAAGTTNGIANASDEITVIYESPTDCLGNNAPLPGPNKEDIGGVLTPITITENHYFVQNETLYCEGAGGALPQPLSSGVINMQILYGIDNLNSVDNRPGGDGIADAYVNADDLGVSPIVSVRIALLLKSSGKVKTKPESMFFYLLDAPKIPVANTLHKYEAITTTIALRNRAS